eukprot:727282-Rhodomonas_salina.1
MEPAGPRMRRERCEMGSLPARSPASTPPATATPSTSRISSLTLSCPKRAAVAPAMTSVTNTLPSLVIPNRSPTPPPSPRGIRTSRSFPKPLEGDAVGASTASSAPLPIFERLPECRWF